MTDIKLTAKQKRFIEFYLGKANFNATKAARLAGYSDKNLNTNAFRLLQNTVIAEIIKQRMSEMVMSADETLIRLSEQSKSSYSDYLLSNGTVDLVSLIADGKAHLIKSFKHTKEGLNVEFYDAQSALKTVAKHHGLLDDQLNIKIEGEVEKFLDTLESELDQETYDRILGILESSQAKNSRTQK